jgi:methylated-DNA-[protein]-cysteine S-methyltransferase
MAKTSLFGMPAISMHSPVGDLTLFAEDERIIAIEWGWGSIQDPSPLLTRAKTALDAYFDGESGLPTDLPLAPQGTPYRLKVWDALRKIPNGETRSYLDIARIAGGSPRSVGGANARNPIPILIPCHRVLATTHIGGYSGGEGLETKRILLGIEQRLTKKTKAK